jgi:hypothetical protein
MRIFKLSTLIVIGSLVGLTSCIPDENCKNCEAVVYDVNTNQEISRTSAVEYCGDDLTNKENASPVTIGNEKTVWECK